ncbi:tyrosine phosphatase family protein [Antarcticirhabdus aurantiaca]|uniref:Protein-tyrosine-phosphatase n=1 Tax=Antarcticirhabdus aurantiaca TaxID=2606717 RepID=A0ACD4NUE9_9HYPH|nr:protein-tyrosine-phosphatase [Antarcticirhabdus aurantiaca]WAJ30326.1 protein-tyrosine-phosphatase [Jeongeuplla avenae]
MNSESALPTKTIAVSTRTICGIEELPSLQSAGVTHVLSILDPGFPELPAFEAYGEHRRTTLHFHDIIDPLPGQIMPKLDDLEAILAFGSDIAETGRDGHLLVHCHMGVSRSTAAMITLMAQSDPDDIEDDLFARLREIRPRAWPNSVMIGFADDLLSRQGRLVEALRRHYAHQIEHEPRLVEWMGNLGRSREVQMATKG